MSSKTFIPSESKDLEMYIKYSVIKFLQCVTNSRHSCEKLQTDSKILLGIVSADWFNLCIPDSPLVLEEVKALYGGKAVDLSQPVCIEIYLKTPDNETMTIEFWWISKASKTVSGDVCGKVVFYNSLTTLLKSLLLTTRATPGYAIARNQSHTSVRLYHRLMFGEPCLKLFEHFKKHMVGKAPSPIGTVEVHVAWKCKLALDSKRVSQTFTELEDNYINFATHAIQQNKNLTPKSNLDLDFEKTEDEIFLQAGKKAAFGSPFDTNLLKSSIKDEVPFASLLKYSNLSKSSASQPNSFDDGLNLVKQKCEGKISPGKKNPSQSVKQLDDFVIVEPNYPFGNQEELAKFCQEFEDAPPLSMFENDFQLEESLSSILEQIAQFESNAAYIDDFVNSLEKLSDA